MKKILLLLAIMLPLVLTSCGDDNDVLSSLEKELVGEWAIVRTPESGDADFHYVFNKERTGSRRHLVDGTVVTSVPFKWTLDGKRLTLEYVGQQLAMDIELGINSLHVVYVATGATEDYTRVIKDDDED